MTTAATKTTAIVTEATAAIFQREQQIRHDRILRRQEEYSREQETRREELRREQDRRHDDHRDFRRDDRHTDNSRENR